MKKNIAISIKALRAGDKDALQEQGIQQMDLQDIAARNADAMAHANHLKEHGHKEPRASLYPSIGDQLDALWKAFDAMVLGKPIPEEAISMRDTIAAVKNKFPKNQG